MAAEADHKHPRQNGGLNGGGGGGGANSKHPSLSHVLPPPPPEPTRAALFDDEYDILSGAPRPARDTAADGDDGASSSSPVTSPVVQPPYWTQSHSRTVSNLSTDSVLPVGAITLQDNEDESGHARDGGLGRDRNRACWAKSVEVTDYVVVNGSATNIGAFVVWNIRVETLTGSYINIRKRYSEFDELRYELVQTFPGFEAAVPTLPPKSVISKFRPKFLEKRRAGLQYFLNCILLNPEFSGSPVLKEFLFS